jgi:hypothetical protein
MSANSAVTVLRSPSLASDALQITITGGDLLPAEYKFKDSIDFVAFARLLFSAIQQPQPNTAFQ